MSTHTKWLVIASASVEPLALADGMVFRPKAVIGDDVRPVEVGLQRGLIWRRVDALEVWIEPVYAWDGDDEAAWIIPLPALPEVAESDPKVLDDLDALTAPTFLSFCMEAHCNEDCTLAGCPPHERLQRLERRQGRRPPWPTWALPSSPSTPTRRRSRRSSRP